jgi:gliding motility-associated lipoprotein GldD
MFKNNSKMVFISYFCGNIIKKVLPLRKFVSKLKTMKIKYLLFFLLVLFTACSSDYSPKPSGHFRIDMPTPDYEVYKAFQNFEFALSNQAQIVNLPQTEGGEPFNIIYPQLNAHIYCSYIPFEKTQLMQLAEQSRKFVYIHATKADAIQQEMFENPEQNVFGMIYDIKGNVATPTQFVLTDSISNFFRGALYFDNTPNQDSIAPVLEYINQDIQVLIESFRWKK